MAIFMATTKSISRSNGKSAVASASYRAGEKLQDERYGKTQDYSKRHGVMSADIILPSNLKDQIQISRNELWNMAEKAEKRKDSRVAREWIVNLPHELDEQTRKDLAHTFTQALADKYGVIADCCIHRPTEKEVERGADPRNFHAHIMLTTRQAALSQNGKIMLGEKATIELSDTKRRSLGLERVSEEITEIRQLWEHTANEKLAEYGHELIDSRSYQSLGIDIEPQIKMGKNATQMERDGIQTPVGDLNRLIKERNELVFNRELANIERTNQLADEIIFESRKAHAQPDIAIKPPQAQPKPQEQGKPSFTERMAEIRAKNAQKSPEQIQTEQRAIAERTEKAWQEFKQAEQNQLPATPQEVKKQSKVAVVSESKLETVKKPPKEPLEARQENSARVAPTQVQNRLESENGPTSVNVEMTTRGNNQKSSTNKQDWRVEYEAWKAQKNAPISEQTNQPPNAIQTLEQSAMSKYEQWKAEKALVEQQKQLEAERQRQLEQNQPKPTPKHDNDIGFSP